MANMVIMDNILYQYNNGNTKVTILEDGTKIREYEDIPIIEHPESIDVKITNYCDLGCKFCHENSTTKGKHANIDKLLEVINKLPSGVELAIGGGNPLSHPEIGYFLEELKSRGIIPNLTVNSRHIKQYLDLIEDFQDRKLIYGLGISVNTPSDIEEIISIKDKSNVVIHLIIGIVEPGIISKLRAMGFNKILLLGYKKFGRGIKFYNEYIQENINIWYRELSKYLGKSTTMSFDNLAIEQLNIKRFFTKEGWNTFYMGDDFTFTMYIDAVNREFAPTSRSKERVSWKDIDLLEYFQNR